jgi:hypothetical protein
MTSRPLQHEHNDLTHHSSHRDTQQSNASTDTSNSQQRPGFQAFQSHPCITIRRAARGGQTGQAELILETVVAELGGGA